MTRHPCVPADGYADETRTSSRRRPARRAGDRRAAGAAGASGTSRPSRLRRCWPSRPAAGATSPSSEAHLDLGPDLRPRPAGLRTGPLQPDEPGLFDHAASLETALDLACSRCLRPIELPLVVALDEEALPAIDLASGRPLDPTVEPEIVRLTDHHEARARAAHPRGDPAGRADCPDLPARLPGALCIVCGESASMTGPTSTTNRQLDPRLEALRAFRVDGGRRDGLDSPVGPPDRRQACSRRAPTRSLTNQRR